jgi:hypothetical protein
VGGSCHSHVHGAPTQAAPKRKLSSHQLRDGKRLLRQLRSTQMHKWVGTALGGTGAAAKRVECDSLELHVTAADSMCILLLAVCTPPSVLAGMASVVSASHSVGECAGSRLSEALDTCCDTADAVWRQLIQACAADLSDSRSNAALLRSEVFMLQQQLSQARPLGER